MNLTNSSPVIWVVSDTHLTNPEDLPQSFIRRVRQKDIIIHLGDFVSVRVFDFLSALCRLEAVAGNCDSAELRRKLPSQRILEINGKRIGLVHGRRGPSETLRFVKENFKEKLDATLFGHTHQTHYSREGGVLLFNPGSLISSWGAKPSLGILHLDDPLWCETLSV